jgi:hypothetical protein
MKNIIKTSLLVIGIFLISGCSITNKPAVEEKSAPLQVGDAYSETESMVTGNEEVERVEDSSIVNAEEGNVYLEIKELGIKILINKSIQNDLMYFYTEMEDGGKLASLNSRSIMEMDKLCSTQNLSPFFNIVRVEGAPDDFYRERAIHEFKDFFILFGSPNADCSPNKNTMDAIEIIKDNIYLNNGCENCIFEIN